MKRRIILSLIVVAVAVGGFFWWKQDTSEVLAAGDLTINWGVSTGDPIFVVTNALPGDSESRDVTVTNDGAVPRDIAVAGILLDQSPDDPIASFSSVLDFTISEGVADLYTGTLADFFAATATPSSIFLSTLSPSDSTTYTFEVHFQESAGNEFQNAFVIFNLIIGIDTDIPPECADIEFSGPTIFGSDGDDTIRGTHGNDLIFALEGDDRVFAWSGDDCIVGGQGDDELRGETGDDIIFGNEGDDLVIGAVGQDLLFGNDGNDIMRGESGSDTIVGGLGADNVNGHSGTDTCDAEVEVSCEL